MRVVVAGTFGSLRDGHRNPLETALRRGDDGVVVGLTTDEFAARTRRDDPRPIPPYEERRRQVRRTIDGFDEWGRGVEIRRVADDHGFAADPSLDAIVVSPETDEQVAGLNRRRSERGTAPLDPIVVPYALAEDGEPISSTRIVRGEIDEHGNHRD